MPMHRLHAAAVGDAG